MEINAQNLVFTGINIQSSVEIKFLKKFISKICIDLAKKFWIYYKVCID